ncbi:MAG: SPOR domain-containing protein [Aquificaceae bacterium]|nr:SPOR domain-containing protein [Aquificaceae bacterium]MDW8422906.1 SPOR domain-containing protein [Aquificaceae bacterium]
MKKERLIILLGILVALVFFYLGLNEWLKTKEEQIKPPPLVVKPAPIKSETQQPTSQEQEQKLPQGEKDLIAQKIKEEKQEPKDRKEQEEKVIKPQKDHTEKEITKKPSEEKSIPKGESKTYTVQVGAFRSKEGAQKVAQKAEGMGYKVNVVEEDNFYKVRLIVRTNNINQELTKLRKAFGSALIKQ